MFFLLLLLFATIIFCLQKVAEHVHSLFVSLLCDLLLVLNVLGKLLANITGDARVAILAHWLRIPVHVLHLTSPGDVAVATNACEVILAPFPVDRGNNCKGKEDQKLHVYEK